MHNKKNRGYTTKRVSITNRFELRILCFKLEVDSAGLLELNPFCTGDKNAGLSASPLVSPLVSRYSQNRIVKVYRKNKENASDTKKYTTPIAICPPLPKIKESSSIINQRGNKRKKIGKIGKSILFGIFGVHKNNKKLIIPTIPV